MFELIPFERRMNRAAAFDPFRDFDVLERNIFSGRDAMMFRTDVTDEGDSFKLEAELPGMKKEDIAIDIENDYLTITAERKLDEEERKKNFVRRERFYGSYSRSFDISAVNADGIEATFNDGILTLEMPKKAEAVPTKCRLEIK